MSYKMEPSKKKALKEYVFAIILGICLNLLFNCFFSISKVNGLSMYPTLNNNQYILYTKTTHNFDYGDIIIFQSELKQNNKNLDLIKRVIAKDGDKITIKDGQVFVNDLLLNEDYLPENTMTYGQLEYIVPEDSYFVLGDNRENSTDSRELGCVSVKDIKGKLKTQ